MKLDQFLKWSRVAQSGGEAKLIVKSGQVFVNGHVETRRGRKLVQGDQVVFDNEKYIVSYSDPLRP
tara:strand:+ start:181 stop:378 length:198 start_codon:yes stop_codon:yes gene_type:complete